MAENADIPGGPLRQVDPFDTIPEILLRSAERFPAKEALVELRTDLDSRTITYGELSRSVDGLAASTLQRVRGGKPVVAIVGMNSIRWAIAYLAALRTGGCVVPMDRELPAPELGAIIHYSGANIVFFDSQYEEGFRELAQHTGGRLHLVNMEKGEESPSGDLPTMWEMIESPPRQAPGFDTPDPGNVASICYTSGTMGKAKGVLLSHHNICSDIHQMLRMIDLRHDDVFLSVLPIHHTYECTCGFLGPLRAGATVVFCRGLRYIGEDLARSRATVMLGVPLLWESMYRKIMTAVRAKPAGRLKLTLGRAVSRLAEAVTGRSIRRRVFSPLHEKVGGKVRFFISGGAGVDPEVSAGYRELGFRFLQGYGLTESSPIISLNREFAFRDESVGLPLPEMRVRIDDPDEENVGEIVVSGPNVMLGYHNDPEETAKVLRDGWLYTGDFGRLDEEGFLYVTGRKKNVIISKSGKNVYPEEIETMLNRSRIVGEAMVFGRESGTKGEQIAAIVVPDMDELILIAENRHEKLTKEFAAGLVRREIQAFNASQPVFKRIASFIVMEEELPKTTTRKIRRREALKEAGLEPERIYDV